MEAIHCIATPSPDADIATPRRDGRVGCSFRGQIRNGARQFQHAVIRSYTQIHLLHPGWLQVAVDKDMGRLSGTKRSACSRRAAYTAATVATWLPSLQVRPFFERCGYKVFCTLEDFPAGHQRFFMRKSLR